MQNVKILIKNLLDELVDKNEFLIVDIECKPYRQRVEDPRKDPTDKTEPQLLRPKAFHTLPVVPYGEHLDP